MPRREIRYVPGGYYHIYNRGANKVSLFRSEENYYYSLRLLKEYRERLRISVVAYCLMPNHYHWLVRQDGNAPAGLLPQRVWKAYSVAYNKLYHHTGTLFEDRYQAIHVCNADYLLHLCRYIHVNPVKHGIALTPDLWPFSNFLDWIDKRNGTLLDKAFIRAHFDRPQNYVAYVNEYLFAHVDLPAGLRDYLSNLE